jgi:hypothetical protein
MGVRISLPVQILLIFGRGVPCPTDVSQAGNLSARARKRLRIRIRDFLNLNLNLTKKG